MVLVQSVFPIIRCRNIYWIDQPQHTTCDSEAALEILVWHSKAMEAFDENSSNRGGHGDRSDNPGRCQDFAKEPATFATRIRLPI
jgi:hypothetical protein